MRYLTVITALLLVVLFSGCSSMKARAWKTYKSDIDPNIIVVEYYEASNETLLVDVERDRFAAQIEGFGSVGSKKTVVRSEAGEIAGEVRKVLNPVSGVLGHKRALPLDVDKEPEWTQSITILADENGEGGLRFYIAKETGRLKVIMDGNTDMNLAAAIFLAEVLQPMVDDYIKERLALP